MFVANTKFLPVFALEDAPGMRAVSAGLGHARATGAGRADGGSPDRPQTPGAWAKPAYERAARQAP